MSEYLHVLGRRQAENGSQALVVKLQLGDGHEDVAKECDISLGRAMQWSHVRIVGENHVVATFAV